MAVTASRVGTALVTDCGMDEADGTEKKDAKDGFHGVRVSLAGVVFVSRTGGVGRGKKT